MYAIPSYYDDNSRWEEVLNFKENEGFLQSYVSWKYRLTKDVTMVSGLHYSNFLMNNADARNNFV